jgi:hypothetical protein
MQLNRKRLAGSFVVRVTVVKIGDVEMGVYTWLMGVTPIDPFVMAVIMFMLDRLMAMIMFMG